MARRNRGIEPASDDAARRAVETGDPSGADLAAADLPQPTEQVKVASDETEAEELRDASDQIDDTPGHADSEDVVVDDEEQLIDATDAAAQAHDEVPKAIVRQQTVAPVRKAKPTPKRDADDHVPGKRTTPALFVRQSIAELKKTVWPDGETVRQYFIVVLIFVVFIMAFVSALDSGVGHLLLKIFG